MAFYFSIYYISQIKCLIAWLKLLELCVIIYFIVYLILLYRFYSYKLYLYVIVLGYQLVIRSGIVITFNIDDVPFAYLATSIFGLNFL